MKPLPMDRAARDRALKTFASTSPEEPLDMLVVGGGVVGAAAAFDAAGRGLDVGLAEARDFGEGTSSRSSKLVHGGLRYLQMLDFKLVAEALRERDLLLTRTAPHLVRPLPFVFPFEKHVVQRAFIGSGVSLYDALAAGSGALRPSGGPGESRDRGRRAVPVHRHMSRTGLRRRFPGLDAEKYIGALEYFDARVDDARLVLTLARSAHSLGARLASRTEVVDFLRGEPEGDGPAPVIGARLRDTETGEQTEVHARRTILAAGVWTGEAQEAAGTDGGLRVLASKGIHISIPRERITAAGEVGVITQTEKSVLFIIPMGDVWTIGTTDTAWREDVDVPAPTRGDIDYVLDHANAVLGQDLTRQDVLGTWAGLRPLLQPVTTDQKQSASTRVSREHTVMELAPGLAGIAGGKLTTYRVMAQDVVDFASRGLFRDRASLTSVMPLAGAQGFGEWQDRAAQISSAHGWDPERTAGLLNRYGSLLGEVLELIEDDPGLAQPVRHAPGYLRAEFAYGVLAEGARHLDDLLARRTRLSYEVADRGAAAAAEVADVVAPLLGWDRTRTTAEIETYTRHVAAQQAAEQAETDAEAAALLAEAPAVPVLSGRS